ncbi:MAG: hypothetical protein QGH83_04425 [Candidatus Pacebacteria bacterium]|jgi:hypothetical protein|nr:hypothetical protein [Candidatus Paceibacterota bacterium]
MIRFVVGFCVIVGAVGAAEGSAGLAVSILFATGGSMIMLWGAAGMIENGDIE